MMTSLTHRLKNRFNFLQLQRFALLALLFSIFLTLVACEGLPNGGNKNISASWNSSTSTLLVNGTSEKSEQYVEIHDAADGRFLGAAIVQDNGKWAASATTSACSVHIELPTGTAIVDVKNAPSDCTAKRGVGARSVTARDIPVNIKVVGNPTPTDAIPNSVILEPAQDVTILTGQTVNFRGIAVGAGVAAPFSYRWNFGGAAPNSAIQNPGEILFNTPGTYFVELSTSDNLGIPDPTPATRTITVNDPNTPAATTPVPQIIAPANSNGAISIGVGESLFFSGIATDDIGSVNFLFEWDFSGAVANVFGATPGAVTFNQAGIYLVSLYATNLNGIRSATPATITVTVDANNINQAPTGAIIVPPADIVINVGDTINFTAMGADPDLNIPLFYSWDFQMAAPNINMSPTETTGPITFDTAGVFNIMMTVTDSAGESDANPPVRVVTVIDPTPAPGPTPTPDPNPNPNPPSAGGPIKNNIISPPNNVKILPGESVFFSAEVLRDTDNEATNYLWNFDGGALDSTMLTPGDITFAMPGKYYVKFYSMDDLGNLVAKPDTVKVRVHDPSKIEADIESPEKMTVYETGAPVLLDGQVEHLFTGVVETYEWRIHHSAMPGDTTPPVDIFTSTLLAPGTFIFADPGMYDVHFKITGIDALGAPFERTDEVAINVVPAGSLPGAGTGAGAGAGAGSGTGNPPAQVPVINGSAIISPIADMTIQMGEVIAFQANTVMGTNVTYRWDFSGIVAPSNVESPAPVVFSISGEYAITLRISGLDNTGAAFDIFDQRLITVLPQSTPIDPNPPLGISGISLPVTDLVVNAGDFVTFKATIVPASTVTYLWDFAGNAPVDTAIIPQPVQFNTPGSFLVTLKINGVHATGAPITIFDQRAITVLPPTAASTPVPTNPIANSTAPEGYIVEPASALVNVKVGQSITFAGAGFDPLGTGPLLFEWSFGGSLTNIQTQNPGTISFNRVGTHVVTLLVQSASGQFDPTPATVVVIVSP